MKSRSSRSVRSDCHSAATPQQGGVNASAGSRNHSASKTSNKRTLWMQEKLCSLSQITALAIVENVDIFVTLQRQEV